MAEIEMAHSDSEKQLDATPPPSERSPSLMKWTAALTCLVTGTMCNLAVKLQNRAVVPTCEGCKAVAFDQPFWQTFIMFCGESLCLFVFLIDSHLAKKKGRAHGVFEFPTPGQLEWKRTPFWWWALPAIMDLAGTVIVNMAFTMTYASTVQMLRNSILIMTSFISMVMLRRPLRIHEWLGILIMTGGMVASGVQAIMTPDDSSSVDSSKAWLGIVLTLAGTVLNGAQIIVEEKFAERHYTAPLYGVGVEGLFGVLFNLIAIGVAHGIHAYNIKDGWYQMNHDSEVLAGNLWYLVVVFFFNGSGLTTTFLGGGLLRGVMYSCRAPILFLIELCLKWQSFTVGALVGLILSVVGFFTYAYILPGLGKSHSPKFYRAMRKDVPCFCTKPLPPSDDEEAPFNDDQEEDFIAKKESAV